MCLVHACTTASTPELLNRRIREFKCAHLHAFISASSLIMDDSGTIISVLHTVKCVDESIISGTDMIIEVASTMIIVPQITIAIRHTIVGGTLTVIGDSETIISTLETVIGALEIINSGELLEASNQWVTDSPREISICVPKTIISALETVISGM